jgi:histidine phosphotransferase ChpT
MTDSQKPTDLDLASLIASKICHDVIGPVGAIYNGIEILDEDDDAEAQSYALDVIRNVTKQASARLQFARFAFGASGSAGAQIDLSTAEQISRGYVENGKHQLVWNGPAGHMSKNSIKLLLNLISSAITALPRGGTITVTIDADLENPKFHLRCEGAGARPPQHLTEFVNGQAEPELDALSIQAYYTWRLASPAGLRIEILKDGDAIVLAAKP